MHTLSVISPTASHTLPSGLPPQSSPLVHVSISWFFHRVGFLPWRSIGRRIRILHLSILFLRLFRLLRLFLCLLPRLDLCPLLRGLLLFDLQYRLPLFFDLVLIAADDRSSNEADFVNLGNVDATSGVFAFVIKPIL